MKKILIILSLLIILSSVAFASAQENETCIYLFTGQGCPHCARVEPVLRQLAEENPNIKLIEYEVYQNRSNLVVLNDYFDSYNVPQSDRGVPAVFLAKTYLVGDQPILVNIEQKIEENKGLGCPVIDSPIATGEAGPKSPTQEVETISMITIISAALVDSINPCAIAVLLILMGALLAAGDRKRAVKAGLAFTASIYIVYFLFGIGLFSALQVSGLSYWFYKVIGLLAIIIGIFNIKDYFWYGCGGFVMEIPRSWRPTLKNLLKSATTPLGAFLIGFAVCLFELPCTGGPYIFVLGLLAEKATQISAIPILLIYNLFFILPLLIITGLIYAGLTSVESAEKWKERNIKLLHLIAGIIMIILGLVVIFGII